jgi:hypothetical protein
MSLRAAPPKSAVLPLLALVAMAPAAARAAEWTAFETPHFRVLSQVSESRSREIIRRLDIYMQALPKLTNLPVKRAAGVTEVFLLDAADFARAQVGRGKVSGFFLPRSFHNRIVVDASSDLRSSLAIVQHEYVHFAIQNANLGDLPAFYEEGLAKVMESFTAAGQGFSWGHYPPGYRIAARSKFMPLAQVLAMRTSSPDYRNEQRQTPFYSRSLLFLHYCIRGRPEYREPLERLAARLADGDAVETAFDGEFGISLEAMDEELDAYLAERAETLFLRATRQEFDRDPKVETRPLPPGAADIAFADLLAEVVPGDPGLVPALESLRSVEAVADLAAAGLAAAYDRAGRRADADAEVDRIAAMPRASVEALAAAGEVLFARAQDDTLSQPAAENLLRRSASYYDAALDKDAASLTAIYGRALVEVYLQEDLLRTARMLLDAYPRSGHSADIAILLAAHFDALGDAAAANRARTTAACGAISPGTRASIEKKVGPIRCFRAE